MLFVIFLVAIESGIIVVYFSGIGIYHEKSTVAEVFLVTIVYVTNSGRGNCSGACQWCLQYR